MEHSPESRTLLEILLRQIEREIPLNSLYLDLSNDEKIENDEEINLEEILKVVEQILQTVDQKQRESMLERLISSEPFSDYAKEIRANY